MKAILAAVAVTVGLSGCAGMTQTERGTLGGAAIGAGVGSVLGGGVLGTAGGAAVGGVIGNSVSRPRQ